MLGSNGTQYSIKDKVELKDKGIVEIISINTANKQYTVKRSDNQIIIVSEDEIMKKVSS